MCFHLVKRCSNTRELPVSLLTVSSTSQPFKAVYWPVLSRAQEQAVRDTDNRGLMGPRSIGFRPQWSNASVPIGHYDHFLLEGPQSGLHLMELSSGLFFFLAKKKKKLKQFPFYAFCLFIQANAGGIWQPEFNSQSFRSFKGYECNKSTQPFWGYANPCI